MVEKLADWLPADEWMTRTAHGCKQLSLILNVRVGLGADEQFEDDDALQELRHKVLSQEEG